MPYGKHTHTRTHPEREREREREVLFLAMWEIPLLGHDAIVNHCTICSLYTMDCSCSRVCRGYFLALWKNDFCVVISQKSRSHVKAFINGLMNLP